MAVLIDEFGFPPDYWRRMGASEFMAYQRLAWERHVEKGNRRRREEYERAKVEERRARGR